MATTHYGFQEVVGTNNIDLVNDINTPLGQIDTALYTQMHTISGIPSMFAYGSPGNTSGNIHLYCSYDNYNFSDCGYIHTNDGNYISADTKNMCLTDENLFLIASGTVYKATSDLKTFELVRQINSDLATATGFTNVWGQSLFFDPITSNLYTFAACSNTTDNFGIYSMKINKNTLEKDGNPTPITLQNFSNVIDPSVTYYNSTYYMAFKDETNKKCYIATSNNATSNYTPNTALFSHVGRGVEAPQLIELSNRLTMWVDGYDLCADDSNNDFSNIANIPGVGFLNGWYEITPNALFHMINPANSKIANEGDTSTQIQPKLRHPAFFTSNNDIVKYLAHKTIIYPIPPSHSTPFSPYRTVTLSNSNYVIGNVPTMTAIQMQTATTTTTLNYQQIIADAVPFYIRNSFGTGYRLGVNDLFFGGSSTNRYITYNDREMALIIGTWDAVANNIYVSS